MKFFLSARWRLRIDAANGRTARGDGRLLLVTTTVEDPVYLNGLYIVSPHFKKEPDGSKWDPTPCSATW